MTREGPVTYWINILGKQVQLWPITKPSPAGLALVKLEGKELPVRVRWKDVAADY
jgi:hypothetical protein